MSTCIWKADTRVVFVRVERGLHAGLEAFRELVEDVPELPPARQRATVDQAGGYAAGVTGSTIHNFRSYLEVRDEEALRRSIT